MSGAAFMLLQQNNRARWDRGQATKLSGTFQDRLLAILGSEARALWVVEPTGSTLEDQTGNGHLLTWSEPIQSFDTVPVALGQGFAAVLNGTDEYGQTPDAADLSFGSGGAGSDVAFSLVVLAYAATGWAGRDALLSKYGASSFTRTEWSAYMPGSTDGFHWEIDDVSATGSLDRYETTAIATNTWFLHSFTYDGNELIGGLKVYRNKTQVDDTSATSGTYVAMENDTAKVTLGGEFDTVANFWDGRIGFAAIVKAELTSATIGEIVDLVNAHYELSL